LAAPVSARSGSNPRLRIPKDWRLRASPTIKLLAPEVKVVGASRCFLSTYDDIFYVRQGYFLYLWDYRNDRFRSQASEGVERFWYQHQKPKS
jgi:hypothetical protein